jgi:hypothetical protein
MAQANIAAPAHAENSNKKWAIGFLTVVLTIYVINKFYRNDIS